MEAKAVNSIDLDRIPEKVKVDLCLRAIKAIKKPPCGNRTAIIEKGLTMNKSIVSQKQTQRKKIISYLRENGTATIRELFIYCNINSPSKRLSEMRKLGLIDTVKCTKTNAYGQTTRYKRYYLKNGVQE